VASLQHEWERRWHFLHLHLQPSKSQLEQVLEVDLQTRQSQLEHVLELDLQPRQSQLEQVLEVERYSQFHCLQLQLGNRWQR
jgi:hypothetical protein